MKNAIAYTRVSTKKQGKSGLGLKRTGSSRQRFAEAEGYRADRDLQRSGDWKGSRRARPASEVEGAIEKPRSTRPRSSCRSWIGSPAMFTSSPG